MKKAMILSWLGFIIVVGVALIAHLYPVQLQILQSVSMVLYAKYTQKILPPQEITWLQNLTDKSQYLLDKGLTVEQAAAVRESLPNILFIVADDLGYNDLSDYSDQPNAFGERKGANTTHINSIGEDGVNFRTGYSGHSTCTPSRHAMYTGRFPTKTGLEFTPVPLYLARFISLLESPGSPHAIYHRELENQVPSMFKNPLLPKSIPMLGELLDKYGYYNFFFGKWDSGYGPERSPRARGYDESLAFQIGASQYLNAGDKRLVTAKGAPFDDFLRLILNFFIKFNDGPAFNPDEYMTDYLTRQTVKLIHNLHDQKKQDPWFIHLAYTAPHNPFQALQTDYDNPILADIPAGMARVYAAMILALDRGVGQVLQALEDTKQAKNTLVIFTSDNGGAQYVRLPYINAPYRGWKLTLFEGGIRVPLFMRWPAKIAAGTVIDRPTSHVDLVPTIIDILEQSLQEAASTTAAAEDVNPDVSSDMSADNKSLLKPLEELRGEMDGQSLLPLFLPDHQPNTTDARSLYWRSGHSKALRFGDYKLQLAEHPNRVWFYDLKTDPTEQLNLAKQAGVLSLEDLADACQVSAHPAAESARGIVHTLCTVYARLLQVDSEQMAPRWPALLEVPICIDKLDGVKCLFDDEYIITPN